MIGKPQPGIFGIAMAHLGLRVEETIMVGDTAETDIAGAEATGIAPCSLKVEISMKVTCNQFCVLRALRNCLIVSVRWMKRRECGLFYYDRTDFIWLLYRRGLCAAQCTGRMEALATGMIDTAADSVTLAIDVSVMALFLGLMKVAEAGGLLTIIARLLRPLMVRLFPEVPPEHPAMSAMIR